MKRYFNWIVAILLVASFLFVGCPAIEKPVPIIASVTIPFAGIDYAGESLPVTIIGKNFITSGINANEFKGTRAEFKNFSIISDTKVTAEVICPSVAGGRSVTITCGEASATTSLKVFPAEYCFTVGDIVFTDGTRIKAEKLQYGIPDSQISKAFAVIASAPYGGGVGKAVGLQRSSSELQWAPSNTTGYSTNFKGIQADYSGSSSSGYAFSGDIDGSDNWEYICSIDPEGTKDAATNYPAFNFALTYGTTAGLTGTDYENGWYVPSVAELYDVYTNKEVVQTSLNAVGGFTFGTSGYWPSFVYWSSSQVASSLDCNAYQVNFYDDNVSKYYNKYCNNYVLVLQAFNANQFNDYSSSSNITSVTIANAGEGYVGELPVTIIGENLKGHTITCTDASFGNVNYVSDTKVIATFWYDGTNNTITVTSGISKASGTVKVVAAENCYSVGDILFTDGTRIKAEKLQYGIPDSQISKAFAVIASAPYGGGVGKAVGLQRSSSKLQWAPENTTGYNTDFTGIQGTRSGSSSSGYTFSGDIDGSDNWEYICSIDPEGTKDPSTNYPAFNFALTYGTTAGLTGTDYENGWYVPSVAELYDVYTNKEVVQTSLNAVGGFALETSNYWSSSQDVSGSSGAFGVYCYDGSVHVGNKDYSYQYVFVLQAFNVEQFNDYEILDITPPGDVSNVVAKYSASDNKISISWTNPTDEDFAGTILYYNNISNELKGERVDVSSLASSIVISGISADNTTYYITIQTRDTFGNIGTGKNIEVQAANNEPVSCDVETGDFVLSNNKYVKQKMLGRLTQAERDSIVGVVCVTDSGEPLILGLKFPETTLAWTTSQTGLNTYYPDISVTISELDNYGDLGFTGDLDGSDNWEYIASLDTDGAASSATAYPAFYYADMYPYVAGLAGTDFASDWYVPSAKELYDVIKNLNIISRSLVLVGVEDLPTVSSDELESCLETLDFNYICTCFWTSSQSYDFDKSAFLVILESINDHEYSPIDNRDFPISIDDDEYENAGIIKCSRDLSFHVWAFHKFDVNKISKYE